MSQENITVNIGTESDAIEKNDGGAGRIRCFSDSGAGGAWRRCAENSNDIGSTDERVCITW